MITNDQEETKLLLQELDYIEEKSATTKKNKEQLSVSNYAVPPLINHSAITKQTEKNIENMQQRITNTENTTAYLEEEMIENREWLNSQQVDIRIIEEQQIAQQKELLDYETSNNQKIEKIESSWIKNVKSLTPKQFFGGLTVLGIFTLIIEIIFFML